MLSVCAVLGLGPIGVCAQQGKSESERLSEASVTLPDFREVVRNLKESVVNIAVEGKTKEEEGEVEALPSPLPGIRSLGSGFVISADGYIVTNNHVVEDASKIIARFSDDKRDYEAKLIGTDPKTDLALLRIQSRKKLKPVVLGDSDELQVGEWVLAIGNQFQLGQTVTAGIVSATARRLNSARSGAYDAFIQTDASINPGSSGGPLCNTRSEVVGINTAIFSPGRSQLGNSGFNIGIGFSIPSNLAKDIIKQLRETGKVTRGQLGVMIQQVTVEVAEALGVSSPTGALVADIAPGSPAVKAQFKRGDVIIKYDDATVSEHEQLPLMVASTPIGKKVEIQVLRGGKTETLYATISELDDNIFQSKPLELPQADRFGLRVQEITKEIAATLNFNDSKGVLIASVEPGSAAQRGGLARGDVLLEINRNEISNRSVYERLMSQLSARKPVLMLIRRGEGTRFFTLELEK